MRSRTNPAMRLRKIPAATRKACRPTPGCAAGVGGPSGLVEVVTLVLVPSSLVYKREHYAPQAKYSVNGSRNLHYTGLIRTAAGMKGSFMRSISTLSFFAVTILLQASALVSAQEANPTGSYQQTCSDISVKKGNLYAKC